MFFVSEELQKQMNIMKEWMTVYNQYSELEDEKEYLTANDIAKKFNCSKSEALAYMHRSDFPLIECGKELKVHKLAFMVYNQQARRKEKNNDSRY